MSNGTRRSIQQMLSDLYRGFNQNRAVFPRRGRTMPRQSGIRTIPFDVGLEADNARSGGMSENQIQAMLAQARRPGLPISPTVLASVQRPMVENSNNVNAPRGIDSLSRKEKYRRRILNDGFLIPQGSVPGKDGKRVRVGLPNVLYPDQTVPSGPNTLGPATADYLGLRLINPASAEYGEMSNLSPAEATAMRQRNEYGTSDPTPTIPAVEDKERLARDVSLITTDMPGAGASVAPAQANNNTVSEGRRGPPMSRVPVTNGSLPFDKTEIDAGMEGFVSPSDSRRQGTVPLPRRRPSNRGGPDAVGPPVPAVEPIPRPIPKPQMDTGKDAELNAGIDQRVDAPTQEAESGIDFNTNLMKLGLQITAAASKPGATFMGSLATGALNHLNAEEKRELIKEQREFKKELIKSNQRYESAEARLERASREKISAERINVLQEQVKARSEELAETRRFNNKRLELQLEKLPTSEDKEAERNLINSKIGVNEELAKYHEAKASGVGNELAKQTEITKRSIFALVEKMIDTDTREYRSAKGDERAALLQRDARAALKAIGLVGSEIEEFLPGGVTDLSGAGKSPPPPGKTLKFNPQTGKIE